MDSLHFDAEHYAEHYAEPYAEHYAVYSDVSSTPRTPSPHDLPFVDYNKQPQQPPLIFDGDFYPRGSLLQELYDDQQQQHDSWPQSEWQQQQQQQPQPQQHHIVRRATFPYVRHDQQYPQPTPFIHHYPEPINEYDYDDSTPSIKLEDSYPRPPPPMPYHTPHPVQHTDDAASKETQYLRRRCFNCHTTEPPSWRRSTLNPGKIVCNKCGLYERTHLRPRPLRFDELRAGNKARTNAKSKGAVSPKAKMSTAAVIKKEPREFGLVRRSSVSSSSGSGASDWDDNVSVYSSGSAPPTSFNSPNTHTFPLERDSQSPPRDGGIRLPTAPLSDLALPSSPRKPTVSPYCEWQPTPGPEIDISVPPPPSDDAAPPVDTAAS